MYSYCVASSLFVPIKAGKFEGLEAGTSNNEGSTLFYVRYY